MSNDYFYIHTNVANIQLRFGQRTQEEEFFQVVEVKVKSRKNCRSSRQKHLNHIESTRTREPKKFEVH